MLAIFLQKTVSAQSKSLASIKLTVYLSGIACEGQEVSPRSIHNASIGLHRYLSNIARKRLSRHRKRSSCYQPFHVAKRGGGINRLPEPALEYLCIVVFSLSPNNDCLNLNFASALSIAYTLPSPLSPKGLFVLY